MTGSEGRTGPSIQTQVGYCVDGVRTSSGQVELMASLVGVVRQVGSVHQEAAADEKSCN